MKLKSILLFFIFISCYDASVAQISKIFQKDDTSDITFTGTKINPYTIEYDSTGKLDVSGYLDTYYSYYSDSDYVSGYSKFPTIAPRSNQFGINIIQISAKYTSNFFRSTVTLFGGDCPQSAWSPHLNFIQEANAGFRIYRKLWLDAGFFRTHIGLESIQPRENITMSIATTTYFEPYYLSGAKLTWQQSKKLALQINAFNSFNQFLETNKNKAIGFSIAYNPTDQISTSFSTVYCDESHINDKKHNRLYNNFCFVYKSTRWVLGAEGNFGYQQNTSLTDSLANANMFSSLLALKYRLTPKWAVYTRGEIFMDPDEILTGPVQNADHELVGIDIIGCTAGIEFKPIPNSYLRLESRILQTEKNETIFYYNGSYSNKRLEFIVGLGVWF